jgi:predicted GNAT family acetyltransferase
MEATVTDNEERHRFELRLGERLAGHIDYTRSDGVVSLNHAEVASELRNLGYGETMVKGALDDVRERGAKMRPLCPFVAAYVKRHPEVHDLVAD